MLLKAVALQTDGKIVLAGVCTGFASPTAADFCLVRLNNNGTLDTTFNTTRDGDGFPSAAVPSIQAPMRFAIQTDGKIVAAGYCDAGTYDNICVARFLANGTARFDGTFGGGSSRVVTQAVASMHNRAYSLALLHNGRFWSVRSAVQRLCGARLQRTARWTRRSPPGRLWPPAERRRTRAFPVDSPLAWTAALFLPGGPIRARWY